MSHAVRHASPLAVAFVAISILCAMDAAIKYLGSLHSVAMVTLGRYAAGAIFAYGLYLLSGRPRLSREALSAHAWRGLFIAVAAYSFFWALSVLPLVEVMTLSFIAPLLIPPIARLLLGERLRWSSMLAGVIGFGGVLVTIQGAPDAADTPQRALGIVAVLGSAIFYAVAVVLLRSRAGRDGPIVVGLLAALMPGLIVAPFAFAASPPPPLAALPWFLLVGFLGTAGIYLLSLAYAQAEAQQLAPLEYTALGWAALYGYLFFDELPRPQVLAGAAIIVAACLFATWDERRGRADRVRPVADDRRTDEPAGC